MDNSIVDIIQKGESQTVEFKTVWKDDHLKTLCAFANTTGGILLLGIEDDTNIAGVSDVDRLLELLPNKIADNLGITPGVKVDEIKGKTIIIIEIFKSYAPISYHGKFFVRSGSVTRELRGGELNHFLLNRYGRTWDEIPMDNFSINDIDEQTVDNFKILANDRIPGIINENNTEILLRKLNLYEGDSLKRAAVLLFAKEPQKYFIQSHTKIGKFLSEVDIISSDFVEGNLFQQVELILTILKTKYLKSTIIFEGLQRKEKLEYPFEALKEIVVNALIHRDYSNTSNLQIKVYDNKISFTNGAFLPPEITIEKLKQSHASVPQNPLMASVFYKAGLIENWGRGTINVVNDCIKYGLPEPEFRFDMNVFWAVIYGSNVVVTGRDTDNDTDRDTDNDTDRDTRLTMILKLINDDNNITTKQLSLLCNVSQITIKRDIEKLKKQNKIKRMGSERTGYWEIINDK